jgi:hypothetical protein
MHWQYRTICRGPNSILKNLYDVVGSKADDYISFYGLRAHGRSDDGGPLVTNQVLFFVGGGRVGVKMLLLHSIGHAFRQG